MNKNNLKILLVPLRNADYSNTAGITNKFAMFSTFKSLRTQVTRIQNLTLFAIEKI